MVVFGQTVLGSKKKWQAPRSLPFLLKLFSSISDRLLDQHLKTRGKRNLNPEPS